MLPAIPITEHAVIPIRDHVAQAQASTALLRDLHYMTIALDFGPRSSPFSRSRNP